MVKFFLPKPKNSKVHVQGKKKKKSFVNCNESLAHDVSKVLKKLQTRQIQKSIRRIREQADEQAKKKHESQFIMLKAISKVNLKKISFYFVSLNLNVDKEQLKGIIAKQSEIKDLQLNESELAFYQLIKNNKLFKDTIEDAQRLRNTVNQKKKLKKEKAKIKKKHKVQQKNQKKSEVVSEISQRVESNSQISHSLKQNFNTQPSKAKFQQKTKPIQKNFKKQQRTEFKKTGRNKFLKQKFQQKHDKYTMFQHKNQPQVKKDERFVPKNKFQRLNHGQPLHPSWQAKRQKKNEMFIQPFEGKITFL